MEGRPAVPDGLVLIGGDSEKFKKYLGVDDPCFGQHFAKTAPECKECTCPVLIDGKVLLLREVCSTVTAQARLGSPTKQADGSIPKSTTSHSGTKSSGDGGTTFSRLNKMGSRTVLELLQSGKTPEEMFLQILNKAPFETEGRAARQWLYDCLFYIKHQHHLPVPKIPPLKELEKYVYDHEGD